MPQAVTQTIAVNNTVTEVLSLGTAIAANLQEVSQPTYSYGTGTTAASIDFAFQHTYTLAAGASTTLVLSALIDDIGRTVAFARIKTLELKITVKTANDSLTCGGAASNPITSLMGGTTPTFTVRRYHLVIADDATGFVVAAGSSDQLKITNSGTASMTFIVSISGCSA
jgi:hypothetical protein